MPIVEASTGRSVRASRSRRAWPGAQARRRSVARLLHDRRRRDPGRPDLGGRDVRAQVQALQPLRRSSTTTTARSTAPSRRSCRSSRSPTSGAPSAGTCQEIDGHDFEQILRRARENARSDEAARSRPSSSPAPSRARASRSWNIRSAGTASPRTRTNEAKRSSEDPASRRGSRNERQSHAQAFGESLAKLGEKYPEIVVLDADLRSHQDPSSSRRSSPSGSSRWASPKPT